MKKILYYIITGIILAGFFNQAFSYDQVFDSIKLRHGYSYQFGDIVDNSKNNFDIGISFSQRDGASITFTENGDFNQNGKDNTGEVFFYTQEIKDQDYIVKKGKKTPAISTQKDYYKIKSIPALRKENNLEIVYKMAYWRSTSSGYVGPYYHTEYQPYEITWCGDGERDNYTEPFGTRRQIYEQCDPNDISESGWGNAGCNQQCEAINLNPSITLEKTAGNGTDSQSIAFDSQAQFKLQVSNNGDENLKNIRIEDPKTSSCAGDINMTLYGNKNDILEIGESFEITCSKSNVRENFINTATVYAQGVITGELVNDSDTTDVTIDPNSLSAISVNKVDANSNDGDNNEGNDTQTVDEGATAVFKITITNTGRDDLINIDVTDRMTANCEEVQLDRLNIGQSHEYTCEHTNVQEDFTNTVSVKATGTQSNLEVSASDGSNIVMTPKDPATCNSIEINPNLGEAPLDVNIKCNASNAATYKIDIKNDQGQIVDSSNLQTADFTLDNNGEYTASCYVDNQPTTSQSCSGNISVGPISSSINIVKTDLNDYDLDGVTRNDEQKIDLGADAVFEITVTNNGIDDLENVVISDTKTTTCEKSFDLIKKGESETYTCTQANVFQDFTNTAIVTAKGKDTGEDVRDEDDTDVIIDFIEPATCNSVEISPNRGEAPLDFNVKCNATKATSYRIEIKRLLGGVLITGNNSDQDFTLDTQGEYSVACYINNARETSSNCISSVTVTDGNDTQSAISIIKTDANQNDQDGSQGNDSQKVAFGSSSAFEITVTNTGVDDLLNVVITDDQSADCNETFSEIKKGESKTYPCRQSSVTQDFVNIVEVTATGKDTGDEVSASDDTQVLVDTTPLARCDNIEVTPSLGVAPLNISASCTATNADSYKLEVVDELGNIIDTQNQQTASFSLNEVGVYNVSCYINDLIITPNTCANFVNAAEVDGPSISIDKTDANPDDRQNIVDSQTIAYGSGAVFEITVRNNGTVNLSNVSVVDEKVPACDTTLDLNSIGNQDGVFNPGEAFTYTCEDTSEILLDYENIAKVTANVSTDINQVVEDEDNSFVVLDVSTIPQCTDLSLSQRYGTSAYTSNFECSANNADSYLVTLDRPDGDTESFTGSTGTFNIDIRGQYLATCIINNISDTPRACIKTLEYGNNSNGSIHTCQSIFVESDKVTCTGNSRARSFRLDCGNDNSPINTSGTFSLDDCNTGLSDSDDDYITNFTNENIRCYVNNDDSAGPTDSDWRTREACYYDKSDSDRSGGYGGYCGDGAVQRPNSRGLTPGSPGFMEQCDVSKSWCVDCQIVIETYPSEGNIDISGPNDSYIIGNNMSLYQAHTDIQKPVIKNTSSVFENIDNDIFIDELCALVKSGDSLTGEPQCRDVGLLMPGEKVEYSNELSFTGNTTSISSSSQKNVVSYTIKHEGQTYEDDRWSSSLRHDFDVIVKKPTVVTTGGGTAYVGNTNGLSDNSTGNNSVVDGDKNITGTSVGSLSSGVKETSVSDSSVGEDKNSVVDTSDVLNATNARDAEFIHYNGLENVYYYKGNLVINDSSDLPEYSTNENKTYIVEGDLTIKTDIVGHAENLGFIVLGEMSSLNIDKSVKELKGTFVVVQGDIKGSGGYTTDQVIIYGSMYGNMNKLLEKRTYIKNNDGVIDVGTIVSFGSSVFRKPAPLTSKFIGDYLEAQKTAK